MTKLWWDVFLSLVHDNMLNRTDPIHLECIRLCFLPVAQCRLDPFKDTWNHHRMRANRRNDKLSAIPNNLYNMSLRYGIIDYAFPLPSTIDELSGIQDTRVEPVPLRGCSEEFLFLIEQLEGINKGDLDVIETPEQARTTYEALLPLISAYDVDNISVFHKLPHT